MSDRDTVQEETYKGFTISVVVDSDPSNPREWSNVGTFITWHRDYSSPDGEDFRSADDFIDFLNERKHERHSADPGVVYLWIDHEPYNHGWESVRPEGIDNPGRYDGVIYMTYEQIRKEWRKGKITDAAKRENVYSALECEVKTYSLWASGQVYGYVVGDDEDDHIDSCWGFISWEPDGDDYALEQGKEAIDGLIAHGRTAAASDEDCEDDAEEEIAEYVAHMSDPRPDYLNDPRASITHPDAAAYAMSLGPQ